MICLGVFANAQSSVLKEWKDQDKVETSYHFYPSTLRMINLERDPNFDKLVKPIRKLAFMNLRPDSLERKDLRNAANRIIKEEKYETYIELEGPDNSVFVLGNDTKGYTCVLAYSEDEYYMAEIQGMIDIMQLSKLYEKITTADSTSKMGILNVLDLMNSDKEKKRAQAERWRKRRLERARRDSIEQVKQDSINALDPNNQEVIQG